MSGRRNPPAVEWTPAQLFTGGEVGDYWDFSDLTTLYQDTGKTTPVTTNGDLIGCAVGQRGTIDLIQGTTSEKPVYAVGVGDHSQNGITTVSAGLRRYLAATGVPFVGTDQSIAIYMYKFGTQGAYSQGFGTSFRMDDDAPVANGVWHSNDISTWLSRGYDYGNSVQNDLNSGLGIRLIDSTHIIRHNAGTYYYDMRRHNGTSEQTGADLSEPGTARTGTYSRLMIGYATTSVSEYPSYVFRALAIDRHLTDAEKDLVEDWMVGGIWS